MLTARRIAPLLRSLLLGAVASSVVVTTGAAVIGCADENDPQTWVKYLEDPGKKPAAVKRLIQFFDDAMTKDKDNREGEHVKPLLDVIIPPLTEQCVNGDLDDRTRSQLVKLLSDSRDKRAEPCFVKTL